MLDQPLPTPLHELLSEEQPEERLQRIWLGVAKQRMRQREARRLHWVVAAACAVVALVLGTTLLRSGKGPVVGQRTQAAIPSSVTAGAVGRALDFGDSAQVVVDPGGKLDVLDQSSHLVLLALRHGTVRFDVRPGGTRSWRIECGSVSVEVIGTEFVIERGEQSLRVAVQRGRVLVRGAGVPDAVQAIDAGKQIVVDYHDDPALDLGNDQRKVAAAEDAAFGAESSQRAARPLPRAQASVPSAEWHRAAVRKDWKLAWESLGAAGVEREAARADDVAELLTLADVARLSGHPAQSVAPLRQIVRQHAGDSRAALAAFTLGKVLLDDLGRASEAAAAFERAVALKLPETLAEDAQARIVEAYARASDPARARTAASVYRKRFPAGNRAANVERWSPSE